jgi:hypothetical protein
MKHVLSGGIIAIMAAAFLAQPAVAKGEMKQCCRGNGCIEGSDLGLGGVTLKPHECRKDEVNVCRWWVPKNEKCT